MKLSVRSGLGLVVVAALFAAPAMGQEASNDEEDTDSSLQEEGELVQDAADVAQGVAEEALDRRQERPSLRVRGTAHPAPSSASSHAAGIADESVQGLEALTPVEDDAAKAVLQPSPSLRGAVRPGTLGSGLQGAEGTAALGDDALHVIPVSATSYGDDVVRGAGVATYADDAARGLGGAASFADDAARVAGGGLAKIGGALAVLGALLAKLFGGKKDE